MKRYISGLSHANASVAEGVPFGPFLVRIERAQYRWHAQKPYYLLRFVVLEPKVLAGSSISGRLYCTAKALWKLNWFLRDFGYDSELLGREEIDDRSLIGLRGVVKITHSVVNGTSLLNFDGFPPASQWEALSARDRDSPHRFEGGVMTYSYTQISPYMSCPRKYRHRYLDCWQEKDTRAAMLFGRAFEQALAAYFRRKDAAVALYKEWVNYQKQDLHYSERDSWGLHAATRRSAAGSLLPGRSHSYSPAPTKPANQVHATAFVGQ